MSDDLDRREHPSPLQALALFVFRTMRDDVRGALGVLALAGAVPLAYFHLGPVAVLSAGFGASLLWVNWRHWRRSNLSIANAAPGDPIPPARPGP